MIHSKFLTMGILGILCLFSCTAPGPRFTEADEEAIRETIKTALDIFNQTGNVSEYTAAYYAEDAVVLPPNSKPVEGHDAINKLLSSYPEMNLQYTEEVLEGNGNTAYLVGTYSIDFLGVMPDDIGKYIEIWERQEDGSWKIIFDIFNSSLPFQEDKEARHDHDEDLPES